jgi:hypothetical protein
MIQSAPEDTAHPAHRPMTLDATTAPPKQTKARIRMKARAVQRPTGLRPAVRCCTGDRFPQRLEPHGCHECCTWQLVWRHQRHASCGFKPGYRKYPENARNARGKYLPEAGLAESPWRLRVSRRTKFPSSPSRTSSPSKAARAKRPIANSCTGVSRRASSNGNSASLRSLQISPASRRGRGSRR